MLTKAEIREVKQGMKSVRLVDKNGRLVGHLGRRRSPAWRMAQLRALNREGRFPNPDFFAALWDVAKALDYSGIAAYNDACLNNPAEVQARIRALR